MSKATYSIEEMTSTEKATAKIVVETVRDFIAAFCAKVGVAPTDPRVKKMVLEYLETVVDAVAETEDVHPLRIRAACCAAMAGAL